MCAYLCEFVSSGSKLGSDVYLRAANTIPCYRTKEKEENKRTTLRKALSLSRSKAAVTYLLTLSIGNKCLMYVIGVCRATNPD